MKQRLDVLLVERRLVESRTKAQWLIKQGLVFVEGKLIVKPGKKVNSTNEIRLQKEFPYVGKGGLKLEKALSDLSISVNDKICMDIGTSIGGFTDCLIKHGAKKVYAIDTATDLLHPSLRKKKLKEKVILMLGKDARNSINITEKVDICTIDVTFASLKAILPNVKNSLKKQGEIIALVKPIFETEFYKEEKFEIIDHPSELFQILNGLIEWCLENEFYLDGITKSHLTKKEGSIEFFIYLKLDQSSFRLDFNKMIKDILK